jgi:predicted dehydrogenase
MRISVVGTGHLGSIHAKLWKQQDDVELVGIVDPNETQGRNVAEQHGASWYPNVAAMPDVDAVVIAAPTSLHYELACECLDKGFHCFIEKPVTATYEQAKALIERASATDSIIQVGHVERFNPALRSLQGYSLEPLFIEAHRLAQFKPRAIDVSVIHDLMIHDIDLLLWMTKSEIVDIQATGVSVLTHTTDICNARLTFANGCVANVTASRISAKPMRKLRVFQRDGYMSIDMASGVAELYRLIDTTMLDPDRHTPLGQIATEHGDKVIVHDAPPAVQVNAILEEQRAFVDSIRGGRDIAVTLRDGAEAVRIAEWIDRIIQRP